MAAALPPVAPSAYVAVLVEEPPVWEVTDDYFIVTCPRSGVRRAYRPSLFFKTFADMAKIAHQWNTATGEVVVFAPRIVSDA